MPLCTVYPDVIIPARCFRGSSVYVNLMPELSKTPAIIQVLMTVFISTIHTYTDNDVLLPESSLGLS